MTTNNISKNNIINDLFKSIFNNKFLFQKIIYHVHQRCISKYHCKKRAPNVEYINWLVEHDRFEAIEWRLANNLPFKSIINGDSIAKLLSSQSTYPLFKRLLKNGIIDGRNVVITPNIISSAIKSSPVGDLSLIERLIMMTPSLLFDTRVYCSAVIKKRIDIAKLFFTTFQTLCNPEKTTVIPFDTKHKSLKLDAKLATEAAILGDLHFLEYLHQLSHSTDYYTINISFSANTIDQATIYGHCHCLKWLIKVMGKKYGCTRDAIDGAALHGNLETIKILYDNRGLLRDGVTCSLVAGENAISINRVDILKYLWDQKLLTSIPVSFVGRACRKETSLDCLKYLVKEINCTPNVKAIQEAIAYGNVKALEYLMDPKNTSSSLVRTWTGSSQEFLIVASSAGHRNIMEFFLEKTKMLPEYFDFSLNSKNLDLIHWLLNRHVIPRRIILKPITISWMLKLIVQYQHDYPIQSIDLLKYILQLKAKKGEFEMRSVIDMVNSKSTLNLFKLMENLLDNEPANYTSLKERCIITGNIEILKYIHQNGSRFQFTIDDLQLAISNNHSPIVQYILDSNELDSIPKNIIHGGNAPLNIKLSILDAILTSKYMSGIQDFETKNEIIPIDAITQVYGKQHTIDKIDYLLESYHNHKTIKTTPNYLKIALDWKLIDSISYLMKTLPQDLDMVCTCISLVWWDSTTYQTMVLLLDTALPHWSNKEKKQYFNLLFKNIAYESQFNLIARYPFALEYLQLNSQFIVSYSNWLKTTQQ